MSSIYETAKPTKPWKRRHRGDRVLRGEPANPEATFDNPPSVRRPNSVALDVPDPRRDGGAGLPDWCVSSRIALTSIIY